MASAKPLQQPYRSISEPPVRRSHAEITATMQSFGIGLDIDAIERHKLQRYTAELSSRRPHAETVATLQSFGVDLDIDARRHRLQGAAGDASARQSHAETTATMQAFGVDLDIDAIERHKLQRRAPEPSSRPPHSEIVSTMQAFGVDLDIDARHRRRHVVDQHQPMSLRQRAQLAVASWDIGGVMKQRQLLDEGLVHVKKIDDSSTTCQRGSASPTSDDRLRAFGFAARDACPVSPMPESASVPGPDLRVPDALPPKIKLQANSGETRVLPDVSYSGNLAAGRASRDIRLGFCEYKIVADRWAELMGRPLHGIGKSSVWQEEVKQDNKMQYRVPEDAQVLLHEIRGLCPAPVKRRSSSARPAPKCVDELPGHEMSASLLNSSSHGSLEYVKEECNEDASTDSGDGATSPEGMSITLGTTTPDITDSDSDQGVYHIVNVPRGTHSLLRSNNVSMAASCHSLDLPLGFRRMMAAVLPADPDSSLQLSSEQMRALSGLSSAVQNQKKRPSFRRVPRTPRACPNSQRPSWQ